MKQVPRIPANSMNSPVINPCRQSGFTIIELVIVILILGIIAAIALPKISDLSRSAKIATLEGIAGSMRSTIAVVRGKAYVQGLSVAASNPGNQSAYLVETEAGRFEVDWRNLCPESRAELGDALSMPAHTGMDDNDTTGGLQTPIISNRYTRIGYDIRGNGPPTLDGCYITYDSFGDPDCTVDVIKNDC